MRALLSLLPFGLVAQTTVSIDNERVRILTAIDRPHQPTALHKHEFNRVMIYLDDGSQDISIPGAPVEHHQWKAGDVVWSPGGPQHVSENVGTADLHIVEIEIKKPAPAAPPVRKRDLDPLGDRPLAQQAHLRKRPGPRLPQHPRRAAAVKSGMSTPAPGAPSSCSRRSPPASNPPTDRKAR